MVQRLVILLFLSNYLTQVYAGVRYPGPLVIMSEDSSEFLPSLSAPFVIPYPSPASQHIRVRSQPKNYFSGVEPKHFFHRHHLPGPVFFDADDYSTESSSYYNSDFEDFDVSFSDDTYIPHSLNFMDMSDSSEDSSDESTYPKPYVSKVITLPHQMYHEKVIIPEQNSKSM